MSTLDEIVPEIYRCPVCGESRMDYLEWIDEFDQILECGFCHNRYKITE